MILCCGEALIDMIPAPTVSGPDGFVPHCGRSVFNTAIALGRLGAPVAMFTGLSTDPFGTMLASALAASHVDTAPVVTSSRPTTLAFVQLVNGQATYTFYDENSAGRMIAPADLPAPSPALQCLFFGGISLCNPPAADAYLALAEREADNVPIMLDPNIRPDFAGDVAAYRTRLMRMLALADIVKVSTEDLNWMYPEAADTEAGIARLMRAGPCLVLLTRGGDGATGYPRHGQPVSVAAPAARLADTVGAGDTFNAGFLAQAARLDLLTGPALADISANDLRACLEFGARAAAITVSRAGANPPWLHELDRKEDGK